MKKSSVVLSIIAFVLAVAAFCLLGLQATYLADGFYVFPSFSGASDSFLSVLTSGLVAAMSKQFTLQGGAPLIYNVLLDVMAGLVVAFWLWHFIKLIVCRRPAALVVD
jgi:hypothetical protein